MEDPAGLQVVDVEPPSAAILPAERVRQSAGNVSGRGKWRHARATGPGQVFVTVGRCGGGGEVGREDNPRHQQNIQITDEFTNRRH
jgi:hypothetical protein